jgi:light-independent protochlorophyllide reductase subunit B
MGFEGANVLFDTWVQPLMMGLEEHLLTMFSDDFEFHAQAGASHLGTTRAASTPAPAPQPAAQTELAWADEAEKELSKIPFFVRGKARRNTERFARERGVPTITLETLYDAKSHFSR